MDEMDVVFICVWFRRVVFVMFYILKRANILAHETCLFYLVIKFPL